MLTKILIYDSVSKGDEQRDARLAYPTYGQGGKKNNNFPIQKLK
jgi:hypothetical protein